MKLELKLVTVENTPQGQVPTGERSLKTVDVADGSWVPVVGSSFRDGERLYQVCGQSTELVETNSLENVALVGPLDPKFRVPETTFVKRVHHELRISLGLIQVGGPPHIFAPERGVRFTGRINGGSK